MSKSSHSLLARSKSLSPSDQTTSTLGEIEQLRREAPLQAPQSQLAALDGDLHDRASQCIANAVVPPVSFELAAKMSRAHLANTLCSGSGQLYVHTPAQVPAQYYICAKSLLEFTFSLRGCGDASGASQQRLKLRLVLFADRERRYVYVLAETSLPLRDTPNGTFQFFVPPITNPRQFLGTSHSHLPEFKMQLFVTVDAWTGYIGDVWCGSLRSTRAASNAVEISNEAKLVGQKLRGRAPPPFLSENDDEFLKAAFAGTCHVRLTDDSVLNQSMAVDVDPSLLLPQPLPASVPSSQPLAFKSAANKVSPRVNLKKQSTPVATTTPPRDVTPSRIVSFVDHSTPVDPTVVTPTKSSRKRPAPPSVDTTVDVSSANAAVYHHQNDDSATVPIFPSAKRAAFTKAIANLNATTTIVPSSTKRSSPTPLTTTPPNNKAKRYTNDAAIHTEPSSDDVAATSNAATTATSTTVFGSSPDKSMTVDTLLMPPPPPRDPELTLFFSSPSPPRARSRTSATSTTPSSGNTTSSLLFPFGSPLGRTRSATRRLSLNMSGLSLDDLSNDVACLAHQENWSLFSANEFQ